MTDGFGDLYYVDRRGERFGPLGPSHGRDYPIVPGIAIHDDDRKVAELILGLQGETRVRLLASNEERTWTIETGQPEVVRVDLTEDISMQSLGVCGGIMDIYLERW